MTANEAARIMKRAQDGVIEALEALDTLPEEWTVLTPAGQNVVRVLERIDCLLEDHVNLNTGRG